MDPFSFQVIITISLSDLPLLILARDYMKAHPNNLTIFLFWSIDSKFKKCDSAIMINLIKQIGLEGELELFYILLKSFLVEDYYLLKQRFLYT